MKKYEKNLINTPSKLEKPQAADQTPSWVLQQASTSASLKDSNKVIDNTQKGNVAKHLDFLEQNLILNTPVNRRNPLITAQQPNSKISKEQSSNLKQETNKLAAQPSTIKPKASTSALAPSQSLNINELSKTLQAKKLLNNSNQAKYKLFTPSPTIESQAPAPLPPPFQPLSSDELHQRIQAMVIYNDPTVADNQALIKAMQGILQLKPSLTEIHAMLLNALYLKITLGAKKIECKLAGINPAILQSMLLEPNYGRDLPSYSVHTDSIIKQLHNAIIYLEHHLDQANYSQLSGNDALPLWQKFILGHCKYLLTLYLQKGNQWFHKEPITKAKQQLISFAIQALNNYYTKKDQLPIFSYLSLILTNVCKTNQQLESKKSSKRLSCITLPSFEEYQDLGYEYHAIDHSLYDSLSKQTAPTKSQIESKKVEDQLNKVFEGYQNLVYEYYAIDEEDISDLLSNQDPARKSQTESRQLMEAQLSELKSVPKEWQELLNPLIDRSQIDIYEGRLGVYLDRTLNFVDVMKKSFASEISNKKLAGRTAIARRLEQKFDLAFAKTQDRGLSFSELFEQLSSDSLSGDILLLAQGYQLACEDLLRKSKATTSLALAEHIRQAEANHKLGAYIFSGFDNWLRKLYTITLRHITDRQGHLLPAVKASIDQGDEKRLANIFQQMVDENQSIHQGEQILAGFLHFGLLNKIFAVVKQKLEAKEFGLNEKLFLLLPQVKRFHQLNLMRYPFLSELKTILLHLHYLCQQERGLKNLALECKKIQEKVDGLLTSKTSAEHSKVLETIVQAKDFFASLTSEEFSAKAREFLAEVQPLLVYWLSSLPNFITNSLYIANTPVMSLDFLQAFAKYFGKNSLEQPSTAPKSRVVASFITNKQSSKLEPRPSEDDDEESDTDLDIGGNSHTETVNGYWQRLKADQENSANMADTYYEDFNINP